MNGPADAKPASRIELIALLLAAGIGIGLVFPLSKLAAMTGLSPLSYIGSSALGASIVLFLLSGLIRNTIRPTWKSLRYGAVAGALTYAIPFGTLTFVVAHIGSGIPAVLQSLTPMLTLALVSMLRMERLGPYRIAGLSLGFAGVLVIVLSRTVLDVHAATTPWLAAAFVTPVALACGNVYRSYAWPPGEKPVALAALTFAVAAVLTLALDATLGARLGEGRTFAFFGTAFPIVLAQSLASGFGYFFFFRLQQAGGPIYLSQISYVNTTVGVAFAAFLFGEPIGAIIVVAVLLIFAGIALVNIGTHSRGMAQTSQ